MFPCWDSREDQLEKIIAYAQALQYWAEKSNLPMPGPPCLLTRCILKLREMMEQYISFLDDTVLDGVALLEGFFKDMTKITIPRDALPTFTNVPTEEVAIEEVAPIGGPSRNWLHLRYCMRSRWRLGLPQISFPVGGKCCTPSWPVTAAGQASPALSKSGQRHQNWSSGERRAWFQRAEECLQVKQAEGDSASPLGSPEPMQQVTLPRLQGSDGLPVKGPTAFDHPWGPPGAHATRSNGQTHSGYYVH